MLKKKKDLTSNCSPGQPALYSAKPGHFIPDVMMVLHAASLARAPLVPDTLGPKAAPGQVAAAPTMLYNYK